MPKIETWDNLPLAVREHPIQRMRERSISLADLKQLRLWVESEPEAPDGDWYKPLIKICGQGPYPKTFLPRGQAAKASSI